MKNNKVVIIMLVLLLVITLAGAGAFIYIWKFTGEQKTNEPSIDEILESSVDIEEMTTNLASNNFIRISFKIQTDSKEAKEELEKRDFQVKNIIIQELSEKKTEDLKGKNGQIKLENDLKDKINELMQEGKVVQVYIVNSLLQ
ncbi:flagellar basal body-associated protein FliL [Niallia circulans]|uniref:Flagellar protein FliL n=1 Tax=Niallia circulans TaxID=1397 RepID=A0A0J1IQS4_NIACI|nr:flagellar basal body-associated protein FliL [Niallia circulans]KLV28312.1 flagellar basal body-associated protein FliL [Niallia circulans]MCM2979805.1 flagellar basal body-associated protein FliL [Niallia circulans]MDR4315581.1 flagellar basal body-associated protein FliL [Niallia circulans]MED3837172.1 flagellar basal body-associated protein FliL [Niallia circulans]MED4244242.1 flagellar basal body-associated protein FliL [Niallia circulans]